MEKKYELTNITKEYGGKTLYRIRALKNFGDVKAGDLGGWVQSEDNLSQKGYCWIYDNAKCMDDARMYDNSRMYDDSKMYWNSIMYDDSRMRDKSEMRGNSKMYGYTIMRDNSIMYDNSTMYGNSRMYGNSVMYDDSKMFGNSTMYDNSRMYDNSVMYDNSKIYSYGMLRGESELHGTNKLHGELDSKVDKYIDIPNPQGRIVTGILKNGKILFNIGCQKEISEEVFVDRIYNEDGGIEEHPYRKEYLKIIEMIKLYFTLES